MFRSTGLMPRLARPPVPLAVVAGLLLGLHASPAQAGAAPTAAAPASTTPTLGEAFTPSSPDQIALAEHLRNKGVVFYGAFWCQHCFRQKVLFGQQAGNRLPYVECAKDEAGARACSAAGVMAYPTWVMGSERRVGLQTLQQLAAWSGFQGQLGATSTRPAN